MCLANHLTKPFEWWKADAKQTHPHVGMQIAEALSTRPTAISRTPATFTVPTLVFNCLAARVLFKHGLSRLFKAAGVR